MRSGQGQEEARVSRQEVGAVGRGSEGSEGKGKGGEPCWRALAALRASLVVSAASQSHQNRITTFSITPEGNFRHFAAAGAKGD